MLNRPEMPPNGNGPLNGWVRLLGLVGVPGAISIYLVVNARYQECLATSLTTNLGPAELRARLGEPILDRLAETNQGYWCQWPSHRRRSPP